jgi:hypothetical protein
MFVPIILQLELELQAFHLDLPLPLMLQNLCIRFTMLGWRNIPCSGSVSGRLLRPYV